MRGADPKPLGVADLKSRILKPALTSTYVVNITPPPNLTFLTRRAKSLGINANDPKELYDLLTIPCSEASLPGSSIATNEIIDDHTGVTERHAYRRLYDDRISLTFYVDYEKYYIIKFIESWMAGIVNEDSSNFYNKIYNYRVNFPKDYYANAFSITKFEKNYGSSTGELGVILKYDFIQAFPISIDSMPLSYDSSQLLKCTASFSYSRYFITGAQETVPVQPNPNAPAQPGLNSRPTAADYLKDTNNNTLNLPRPSETFINQGSFDRLYQRQPTFTQDEIAFAVNQERQVQLSGRPPDSGFNIF